MNLPNYFLADLPPEATLSPAMITEACQTLKRNRERYLAQRTTHNLVHLLAEVAKGWLQTDNRFRKLALASGPAETGFSHATLAKGLDNFFRQFSLENLQALLVQDLGEDSCHVSHVTGHDFRHLSQVTRHFWRGPEMLVHIAAGNIPNPALMSIALGFADAVSAAREMREWVGFFTAALRAFDLRRRPEARRVPRNCRMARRQCGIGDGTVR